MREVHLKTACLPISKKSEVCFLRKLDTLKSMVLRMLQTDYQASGRPGTNLEIHPKLLHMTLDLLI